MKSPSYGVLTMVSLAAGAGDRSGTGPFDAQGGPDARRAPRAQLVSSSTSTTGTTTPAASSWLTYGGNFSRTSLDSADPAFEHTPTAAWTSPSLDGPVYGEPLIFGGQVFVATENDTVYALSAANGAVAWSDHLAPRCPPACCRAETSPPTVGITSTMVIDPTSGTLFASAAAVVRVVDQAHGVCNRLGHASGAVEPRHRSARDGRRPRNYSGSASPSPPAT